jgi:SAM-dependent methyltransferase
MPELTLPAGYRLPNLITALSPGDTMFDGRDEHYLQVGLSALEAIEAALVGLPEPHTILDLPCGFGRVTRVLRARYPTASITVCDLDRPAVDFAAQVFDARPIYSEPNFRDLHLGGPFDLIWVGSLLTHLPEHQTRQFLDFAVRHMGPNSRLVVTSHGEHVALRLRSSTYGLSEPAVCGLIAQYLMEGYGYRGYDGGLDYGISLAAKQWYQTLVADSALRLLAYHDRGWDQHQDVLVLGLAAGPTRDAILNFDQGHIPLPLPAAEQHERDLSGGGYFDEDWYLTTFADVAEAVQKQIYPSGFAHFLAFGQKEGRPPFDLQNAYTSRIEA